MKNHIHLDSVNLHYSALGYRENSLKALLSRRLWSKKSLPKMQDIHALKNVTLTINPGERVGLLGLNGAGKSTLLKTIAGLYPISSGVRKVQGHVRALLELGMGFEHEATGRANILYRGLLQNQSVKQMKKLEEDIIEFADLGHFIDYPIKTYSSGMLARLAFAISTAIPGDILLLDEGIAAGDATFRNKAKARIQNLVNRAEIMVLATHDVPALHQLCSRLIILHQGEVAFSGEIKAGLDFYQQRIVEVSQDD